MFPLSRAIRTNLAGLVSVSSPIQILTPRSLFISFLSAAAFPLGATRVERSNELSTRSEMKLEASFVRPHHYVETASTDLYELFAVITNYGQCSPRPYDHRIKKIKGRVGKAPPG